MSPEQAQAQADLDERSDLFSIGAILYECLTGSAPHSHLSTYEAVIVAICTKDVPDVRESKPDVPEALAEVIKRALSRDREQRFSNASELLDALRSSSPGVVSARGVISTPTPKGRVLAEDAALAASPPQTKTSWTSRDRALAVAPTMSASAPASRGPRLAMLGGGTALLAFVITLVAMRFGASSPAKTAASADKPPPELSLRIQTSAPNAVVTIDDVRSPDGVVHGAALSQHTLRVEADGYAPVDRTFLLDGRTELRVDLAPLVAPTSSASSASTAGAAPSTHGGQSAGGGKRVPGPATTKPPATGGGLQLKVDP
jgi:serine/threonine-protein kinase